MSSSGEAPGNGIRDQARGALSGRIDFGSEAVDAELFHNKANLIWPGVAQTNDAEIAVDGYFVQDDRLVLGRDIDERNKVAAQILSDPLKWANGIQNGCFNLIVNDRRARHTLILNDRFGFLPLYIHRSRTGIGFASDLNELRRVVPGQLETDPIGLAELYRFGYQIGDRGPYKAVSVLPPGSLLTVLWEGGLEHHVIWADNAWHPDAEGDVDIQGLPFELRELVGRACQRLHSKGPRYGIKLSGGLDSRLVAACWPGRPLWSYTWGHPRSREVRLAARLADRLGSQHRQINIEGGFFPRYYAAMFEQYGIMEFLHEVATPSILGDRVDLVLDGLVGDVFIGGGYFDDARKHAVRDLMYSAIGYRHPHIRHSGSVDELAETIRAMIDVADEDFPILQSDVRHDIKRLADDIHHDIAQVIKKLADTQDTFEYTVHKFLLYCRSRRYTALQGTTSRPALQTLYPFIDTDLLAYLSKVPVALFQYRELYRLAFTKAFPAIHDIPAIRSGIPFRGPRTVHALARVIRGTTERLGNKVSSATGGKIDHGIMDAIQWQRWLAENEAFRQGIRDQLSRNPLVNADLLGQTFDAVARRRHSITGTRLMLTASYCRWFQGSPP